MEWKHKDAFDGAYGNKASTKLSVSFDTGRLKELPKPNECLKRKLEKGDRKETLETKVEFPKKKIRPNLKTDLMEKLDAQNSKLMDQMETQHRDKLQRMDRMLDLFKGYWTKSNKCDLISVTSYDCQTFFLYQNIGIYRYILIKTL